MPSTCIHMHALFPFARVGAPSLRIVQYSNKVAEDGYFLETADALLYSYLHGKDLYLIVPSTDQKLASHVQELAHFSAKICQDTVCTCM